MCRHLWAFLPAWHANLRPQHEVRREVVVRNVPVVHPDAQQCHPQGAVVSRSCAFTMMKSLTLTHLPCWHLPPPDNKHKRDGLLMKSVDYVYLDTIMIRSALPE